MLLLPIHLWLINLSVGAGLLILWLEWLPPTPSLQRVVERLGRASWTMLILGGLVGGLHGWLIWDSTWQAKVRLLESRVFFGVIEFVFSVVLFVAYDLWRRRRPELNRIWTWGRWILVLAAVSNLWYHFPALFGVMQQLPPSSLARDEVLSSREFIEQMLSPNVLARWTHFTASCLAVAPVVALFSLNHLTDDSVAPDTNTVPDEDSMQMAWRLAGVSAVATWSQWLIGAWVFATQPVTFQYRVTGEDTHLSFGFGLSLLIVVGLSFAQGMLLQRPLNRSLAWLVASLQAIVIVVMTWTMMLGRL